MKIKALLSGRDHAQNNMQAAQMANFSYLIQSTSTSEVFLVDPAWDAQGLLEIIESSGKTLKGILLTHTHADHCGGSVFGMNIEGVHELLKLGNFPIYYHSSEKTRLLESLKGVSAELIELKDGEKITLGEESLSVLHTPGHTPGGICFVAENFAITGDTLFVTACGRVDLPGGNAVDLYNSLQKLKKAISPKAQVYPGHAYGAESAPFQQVLKHNPVMQIGSARRFKQMMGVG